jgi:hypothetical protein
MHTTHAIPVTVDPEAAALVSDLGLQTELERMLEHARQTVSGLLRLDVKFGPAYDTGEERVIIEAVRDRASRGTTGWTPMEYGRWQSTTFSPDVHRHFTLLDEYEPNHGG